MNEAHITPELAYKIKMLPDSPGCYLMKNKGQIIYVGKAVNLKNRVRSYFRGLHTPKVAAMVSRIDDFELMLCQTNFEALTLECNLIKKHRPFYNILLKDDKHYPYLRIDPNEPFPRLTLARRMDQKDGAKYFGPYIGASAVKQVIEEVRRYFPLRTCSLNLPLSKNRRPCMNYQIGRCAAPCAGKISPEDYALILKKVLAFLGGDSSELIKSLTQEMNAAAARYEYEQAALIRDKIRDIKTLMEEQHAIQTRDVDEDVIAALSDEADAMVYIAHIRGGHMEGGTAFLMENAADELPQDLIAAFLTQYYEDEHLIPRNVLAQDLPEDTQQPLEEWLREKRGGAVTLTIPQRGDKRDLVLIALKNAENALLKHRQSAAVREERTHLALQELQEAIGMKTAPIRIEGYDISNTSGLQSVAAMVVFENALPNKKQYRIFRIKTVEGPNDFASIGEVISRRLTHGLTEREERIAAGLNPEEGSFSRLPDLILIDGGPEQLAYAQRAMHETGLNIPMFGLAERLEEIWLPGAETPIVLDRRSAGLHLAQYVRDEAHRFGIIHHRTLRGKESIRSRLNDIEGIGPKRQAALIRHFKSVGAIFAATEEELCQVEGISPALARRILASGNEEK